MTPFDIARSYIGTTEGPGPADNPVIMEMYASVGHNWVEHDSVAWCAAFVGHCLEKAGIKSTRKLTARSYLDWGIPIEVADAQQGDIGVIPRGSSSWQGHVFFIDRIEGQRVWGLGGNQDDAVTIARIAKSRLLGARWPANYYPPCLQRLPCQLASPDKPLTRSEVRKRNLPGLFAWRVRGLRLPVAAALRALAPFGAASAV